MHLSFATLLFAALVLGISAIFVFGSRLNPDLWKTLPRSRNLGFVPGILCLVWSAAHALPMFEAPAANMRMAIMLSVPVIAILSYFFLEYIFARALAGLTILGANQLLQMAFVARPGGRTVFALICYAFAIAGIAVIIFPWIYRDMLEKSAQSPAWRYFPAAIMLGCTIIMIGLSLF